MNSKPQQIKMQSTKKGPLTKREESGAQAGIAVLTSPVAEDGASLATVATAPSGAQQPQVIVTCAVPLYPCQCHHTFPRLYLKGNHRFSSTDFG